MAVVTMNVTDIMQLSSAAVTEFPTLGDCDEYNLVL